MRATRLLRQLAAAAIAAVAAGCALKSPPAPEDIRNDALPNTAVPAAWKAAGGAQAPVDDRWLATFEDTALSALVDEALTHNADLQVAAARVEQATGYLKIASASLLPSLSLTDIGNVATASAGGGLNGVFLSGSLEIDVWGRMRYAKAAAQEQSTAAAADYAYARQSLAATVARAWFVAVEAAQQRELAAEMLTTARTLERLAEDRLRIGSGDARTVAEARAGVGGYRDALRQADLAREQALRALELLLGRYPSAEIGTARRLSSLPPPVPVGLPSELLERRPDVIAAERRVAAAFDRVGEAKAARLPRISLTVGLNSISSDVFLLKERDNPSWGAGANLVAPLYQGGALRAQVEIRTAEQKQAVAAYASVGQRAFGEVERALSNEIALRDRAGIVAAIVSDNEQALKIAQARQRIGAADLRTVEQGQLALYGARASQLRVRSEQLTQRVNLHLALGGGFEGPAADSMGTR